MRHIALALCLTGSLLLLGGCSNAGEEQKKEFLRIAREVDEYNYTVATKAVEEIDNGRSWDWVTVTINQSPRIHPDVRKAYHQWRKAAQGLQEPNEKKP